MGSSATAKMALSTRCDTLALAGARISASLACAAAGVMGTPLLQPPSVCAPSTPATSAMETGRYGPGYSASASAE